MVFHVSKQMGLNVGLIRIISLMLQLEETNWSDPGALSCDPVNRPQAGSSCRYQSDMWETTFQPNVGLNMTITIILQL